MLTHTARTYRTDGRTTSSRFIRAAGVIMLNSKTRQRLRSIRLSHCTYCLMMRGNSPTGPIVTTKRACFTVRAQQRRLTSSRTFGRLHRSRGHLFLEGRLGRRGGRLIRTTRRTKMTATASFTVFRGRNCRKLCNKLSRGTVRRLGKLGGDRGVLSRVNSARLTTGLFQTARARRGLGQSNIGSGRRTGAARFSINDGIERAVRRLNKAVPRRLPAPRIDVGRLRGDMGVARGG